jgi:voltage-gated potassium channel
MLTKLKAFLNWRTIQKPEYSINDQFYYSLKPFRLPIVLMVLVSMFGTLGYIAIDGFSLIDAIYQTGITFTTVGFGEIAPISDQGRIFTILLIVLGFAVFSFSVGLVVEVINRGELMNLIQERSMLYKIARLKNHFVIFYHNDYTIELSKEFRAAHIPFVVVDDSPGFKEEAIKHKYPFFIHEAPHLDIALRKSHLSSAKGAIVLSDNMANNIAQIATIRLFEQELQRKPYYVITTSKDNNETSKLTKLGADSVITPNKLMAKRIGAMAFRPDMENLLEEFLYKRDTPLDMEEVKIPNTSWAIFKKLKEMHLRDIAQISIVGIKEKDGKFIPMPKGDTQVLIDSTLLVIGTSEGISIIKKVLSMKEKPQELKYA